MLELSAQYAYHDKAIELVENSGVIYSVTEKNFTGDAVGRHNGTGGVEIMLLSMVDLKIYLEKVSGGYGDGGF